MALRHVAEVLRQNSRDPDVAAYDGTKNSLISAADTALYAAKREGKNGTVRALTETANVVGGE